MIFTIIQTSGGLGLFLLGMIVMTDGLQELAGGAMRRWLMRFTRSPLSGAITGSTSTAILQSSSVTTVAAVGFVGAGLLSFPEALGIIFGANIGTTVTGWLVALLGFKLNITSLALPLIFVGALLRLFTHGRMASTGYALAGFGLIFVGIDFMQQGMADLSGIITPEHLPQDNIIGRLQLVGFGIIVTIITQSSSAGVAMALTALYAGAINFEQAAALVIGMNVGTTVTAIMATIGGTIDARRTGLSHLIYNLVIGVGALFLITPYTELTELLFPGQLSQNPEIGLVAFHTLFNTLGVVILLPFTYRFAAFIERLIPGQEPAYTARLEPALLQQPPLALTALQKTLHSELLGLLGHVAAILSDNREGRRVDLLSLQFALDRTSRYLNDVHLESYSGSDWERTLALSHSLDHIQRLHERCEEDEDRAITARKTPELSQQHELLLHSIGEDIIDLTEHRYTQCARRAAQASAQIIEEVHTLRESFLTRIARDEMDIDDATHCLEAIRWLERVSRHIARITYYFEQAMLATGK